MRLYMWRQGVVQRLAQSCAAVAVVCGLAGAAEAAVTKNGSNLNIVGNTTAAETFTLLGTGTGNVTVTSSAGVQPFTGIVNVNIDGGGGFETINITALNITGNLNTQLRTGGSAVAIQGATEIDGKTTVVGTTGDDSVGVLGSLLRGDVFIHTGANAGTIELDDVTAQANVWLQAGDNSVDRILLENGTSIFNDLMIITGHGSSDIDLQNGVTVGRNLMVQCGRNADDVTFTDSGAYNDIAIYTYEGYDLVEFLDDSGTGHNLLISTGTEDDDVYLTGDTEGGAPSVGNNLLIDTVEGEDYIEADGLYVDGSTHVNTGADGDELLATFCDFNVHLTLLTGQGEDDATATDIHVGGNTVVKLGTENDDASVTLSVFDGTVAVDGGAGIDTLVEVGNTYNGGPPTVTNVP